MSGHPPGRRAAATRSWRAAAAARGDHRGQRTSRPAGRAHQAPGPAGPDPAGGERRGCRPAHGGERAVLGGIVKHLAQTEAMWVAFVREGAASVPSDGTTLPPSRPGSTPSRCCPATRWRRCSPPTPRWPGATDELVASLPSLDAAQALPEAPWFEPGDWSARRVLLHSWPRPLSTPATPTSSARPSTAPRPWAERGGRRGCPPDWAGAASRRPAAAARGARAHDAAVRDGRDWYPDPATGFFVLTADPLAARGACCGSGCRHCPYPLGDDG